MADSKVVIYAKTGALLLSCVAIGLAASIFGPTILELQCTVGATYEDIIKILPARASGYALGSLLTGVLFDRMNPLLTFVVTLTTMGACLILMPWATSLVSLLVIAFVCGICGGMIDASANISILYIWGKESQPYMQSLHFAFGFGGLVAPLLASQFLSAGEAPIEGLAANVTSAIENSCKPEELRIHLPYAILGTFCILSALVFLYLFCCHRQTDEHPSRSAQSEENMAAGVKKNLVWAKRLAVAVAAMFLFTLLGFEIGMGSFINSFAVMSDHHLTKQVGAYMTSVFWFTFTFFRLAAIPAINKLGLYRSITLELVILVISNIFLLPFGNSIEWCLWVGVALVGIAISTIYGCTFVLLESYFPVTSGTASLLTIAACTGEFVFPVIMGYAIESQAQLFLWVIFASTVICCTLFAILSFICKTQFESKQSKQSAENAIQATVT
ncbi:Major facilitator superfamily domain-containing protein 4A [Halotydeus destructor]|nr:Major facilitator superfamily domain-containing protein 4A [Halotydeus destructor]